MDILLVLITVAIVFVMVKLILKEYNTVFIFIATGIIILMIISAIKGTSILPEGQGTGNIYLDVIEFVRKQLSSNTAGLGIILMTVTGYAMFMSHIGASTKLALRATKPLKKLNKPYLVLSIIFIIGCMLKLVITSHSGLGLLMVATTFPILLNLGVSRLSAGAVMCFTGFLDWGPNDSSAIFASRLVDMPIMDYFLQYQGKVGLVCLVVSLVFISIYYSIVDKKIKDSNKEPENIKEIEEPDCPTFYLVLPLIPLILVAIFSFVESIKMDVVTANLVSFVFVFILEIIRYKNVKKAASGVEVILKSMGTCFANIVSVIVAAAVFAESIKLIGGVTIVANFLASIRGGLLITMFLMSLITFGAVILLGSGNASWYAFGPLVPDIAKQMGINALYIALPMQLSTSIGRSLSPVAGVVIAVAGLAGVEVKDLIKHSIVPMVVAFITNILASYIILSILSI